MASKPPDAFLSYTRFDDQHDGGAISHFRLQLASAVRAVTGESFEIFQDVDGIGLGERWSGKLDESLEEARFFIPILTPSYFNSEVCRNELEKFLKAEKDKGGNDLVLPIYYIQCPVLEEPELRNGDHLATIIWERQRWDWRDLRHHSFRNREVRLAIEALAREIDKASRRAMLGRTAFTRSGAPRQPKQSPSAPSLTPVIPASDLPATLTWSQALNWLVVGTLDEGDLELKLALEEAWSQQTGEPVPPQRLPVKQARRVLLDLLESGKAVATGRRVSAIGASALQEESLSSDIPASGWPDLRLDDASSFAHLVHASVSGQGYADVRLKREGLIKALQGALSKGARATSSVDDQLSLEGTRPWWTPGMIFRDLNEPWFPEMVVIPPGEFTMGSPPGEKKRYGNEGPHHVVKIGYALAVGRYPLTFDEYDHFARTTGREWPADEGWGRGRGPVINVSWADAKAYVGWLSKETGHSYRLLSEAEWEYACRAGTTTRYSWGDEISSEKANYGNTVRKTTEVGTYPANAWDLCDMHGNVWEWVEDCWNDSYENAPDDGRAWTSGDCSRRVMRGGSWDSDPRDVRSAYRDFSYADERHNIDGFRIARTLP